MKFSGPHLWLILIFLAGTSSEAYAQQNDQPTDGCGKVLEYAARDSRLLISSFSQELFKDWYDSKNFGMKLDVSDIGNGSGHSNHDSGGMNYEKISSDYFEASDDVNETTVRSWLACMRLQSEKIIIKPILQPDKKSFIINIHTLTGDSYSVRTGIADGRVSCRGANISNKTLMRGYDMKMRDDLILTCNRRGNSLDGIAFEINVKGVTAELLFPKLPSQRRTATKEDEPEVISGCHDDVPPEYVQATPYDRDIIIGPATMRPVVVPGARTPIPTEMSLSVGSVTPYAKGGIENSNDRIVYTIPAFIPVPLKTKGGYDPGSCLSVNIDVTIPGRSIGKLSLQ